MEDQNILPTCEIIAIGSELLLGQIVDTNSTYLATELARIGVDLRFRTSVGDNADEMESVLYAAINRCDMVITTGGLGPTADDLTREVVAKVSGCSLEFKSELMEQIESVFKRYGYRMPETNRRQAYVPEGAVTIENPVGTAPAFIKEVQHTPIICLPGVPKELRYLWKEAIAPWIKDRFGLKENRVTYRVLKVAGIGESKVDTLIGDIIKASDNPSIGLLASPGEIRIRITAEATNEIEAKNLIDPIEKQIRTRLGNKIFGVDEDTLESTVNNLLLDRGLELIVLESFTSGKITQRLLASQNSVLKESIVIPRAEDISRRMGVTISSSSLTVEDVQQLARSISSYCEKGIGLAVIGFVERKEDGYFVNGCAAVEAKGMEKFYSWRMGGDLSTVQDRGTVIGLNTLRLALLEAQ